MSDDPKTALRRTFRAARRDFVARLSPETRQQLQRQLAIHAAAAVAGFRTPASYAAISDEIDPHAIESTFITTAFPRVTTAGLTFHHSRRAEMRPAQLGILEPAADAPYVTPDLILVPLLAVTPAGVRLGQGKGYYDRALALLRQSGPIRTIAIGWDIQVTDALPVDPWDIPVDYVATPTRLVDCTTLR